MACSSSSISSAEFFQPSINLCKCWIAPVVGAFLFILLPTLLLSQDVVVSEYYNVANVNQPGEWTELFVVTDGASIAGWTIEDYANELAALGSKVTFKNVDFWRNLRAGTIIVIDHEYFPVPYVSDKQKKDGYLQVCQRDTSLFEVSGIGLNINQTREGITLRNSVGEHVHSLGHFSLAAAGSVPLWLNLPMPKVAHNTTAIGDGHSIRVTGSSIAAYAARLGTDSTSSGPSPGIQYPGIIGSGPSKGLPNLIGGQKVILGWSNENQYFWRLVREPKWSQAPAVVVESYSPVSHAISWTPIRDPFPDDSTTGYVVLRDTKNFQDFSDSFLSDGRILIVGSRIGTTVVVAVQHSAAGNRFVDEGDVPCGMDYTYRVYGYRFNADDNMSQTETADTTARGRQYNQLEYAQSAVIHKPILPKPIIRSSRTTMCPDDTVHIYGDSVPNGITYEWTLNGVPIQVGKDLRLVAREFGTYRLVVYGPGSCPTVSEPIVITSIPVPEVRTLPLGRQSICEGDTITLTVQNVSAIYRLFRNDLAVAEQATPSFRITEPGSYSVEIVTADGCVSMSKPIVFFTPDIRYAASEALIDFGSTGACSGNTVRSFDVTNEGQEAIQIARVLLSPGFALESPAPGFILAPGERRTVYLRFSPETIGLTEGVATIVANPCSKPLSIQLRGERTEMLAALDKVDVDFGVYTSCPRSTIRDTAVFTIRNSGTQPMRVQAPLVQPPFFISFQPTELSPGQSVSITIRYIPLEEFLNQAVNQTIEFPFAADQCTDTLRATLRAAAYQPLVLLEQDTINLGRSIGCSATVRGSVVIRNVGSVPTTVGLPSEPSALQFENLPIDLAVGETKTITFTQFLDTPRGEHLTTDTLFVLPCGQPVLVSTRSELVYPEINASEQTVHFGTMLLCNGMEPPYKTVVLRQQPSHAITTVTSVAAPGWIQTSVTQGTVLTDSLTMTITVSNAAPGRFSDTIVVFFNNCAEPVRVHVVGEVADPSWTVSSTKLDFGLLNPGESIQQTLVIRNTGSIPTEFAGLPSLSSPWRLLGTIPDLPAVVNPGDSVVVTLAYEFVGHSRSDTVQFSLEANTPCPAAFTITAVGSTSRPPIDPFPIRGVRMRIPDGMVAPLGTVASIPVELDADSSLDGRGLKSIRAEIEYDGSLLYMRSIGLSHPSVTVSDIVEIAPGRARLTIRSDSNLVTADTLLTINATTYLGSHSRTELRFVHIESEQAEISGYDGDITITGTCDAQTQSIVFGQQPELIFNGQHPWTSPVLDVTVVTLTDDPVFITIFDMQGRSILSRTITVRPGIHNVVVPAINVPAGVYGVTMVHGQHARTQILVRGE